jgi:hypothetical protein
MWFWKKRGIGENSIESRVMQAPIELLDYLRRLNAFQGYSETPEPYVPSTEFKSDLEAALIELPASVKNLVNEPVVGIFFVKNLGTTALTTSVFDDQHHSKKAFIVLDASLLNRDANEWITWKENSPFIDDQSGIRIKAELEGPKSNNRKNAIQYILLHEFGHVVSIEYNDQPWANVERSKFNSHFHAFLSLSWRKTPDGSSYKFENRFPDRKNVTYYRGPESKLPLKSASRIYESLAKTDFSSLYAVTDPREDFAESFASYVHSVIMHRKVTIRVLRGNRVIKLFHPCWSSDQCKAKESILEQLFRKA